MLVNILDDAPFFIWYGPIAAEDLALRLEVTAREIRKAASALNAASPHWEKLTEPETNDVSSGRPNNTEEVPF